MESAAAAPTWVRQGLVSVPALPEAVLAVAQGWGGDFYSLLLAELEPLPGLSAWGPLSLLADCCPKGPFLLGLICSSPSSVCGVLFSPGDYVNTIDWFVLNSVGCWVIITRC